MKLFSLFLFTILILIQIEIHICFIESSYLAYTAVAGLSYYGYQMRCNFVECCEIKDPKNLFDNIKKRFRTQLFGQPIVEKVLPSAIHDHINKKKASSPLVISLHGWTGSGKTYTSEIIAELLFEKGLKSIYVRKITPAVLFPNSKLLDFYKEDLVKLLDDQSKLCQYSLIIIEEIDKLHPELIDTLSSYLNNYHPNLNHMTFIFTSNVGSDKIVSETLKLNENGKQRSDIELSDFESIIKNQVYNDESAMKYSSLISSHLINHYIPYLPLSREHVSQCIKAYIGATREYGLWHKQFQKLEELVFKSLEWWPADLKLYSTSGCKQVGNKVDIFIRTL